VSLKRASCRPRLPCPARGLACATTAGWRLIDKHHLYMHIQRDRVCVHGSCRTRIIPTETSLSSPRSCLQNNRKEGCWSVAVHHLYMHMQTIRGVRTRPACATIARGVMASCSTSCVCIYIWIGVACAIIARGLLINCYASFVYACIDG